MSGTRSQPTLRHLGSPNYPRRRQFINGLHIAETLTQEGIEKGIQQVAKQMKAAGVSLKDIARYTNLSVNELHKL